MSNAIDFPGGNRFNNYNTSGSAGQPTTSKVCNDTAGQLLTSSLVPSFCWGKTTRHHSSGPQPWLPTSILVRMALFELSPYVPPRECLNDPLPKFAPYRVKVITYSVSVSWCGQDVHTRTKFCVFCVYSHKLMHVIISLCFAMLRNICTGSETRVRHAISDVMEA